MLKKRISLLAAGAIVATLGTARAQFQSYGYTPWQHQGPTFVRPNNPFDPNQGYTITGPGGQMSFARPNNPFDPHSGWTVTGPGGHQSFITPNSPFDASQGWTITH